MSGTQWRRIMLSTRLRLFPGERGGDGSRRTGYAAGGNCSGGGGWIIRCNLSKNIRCFSNMRRLPSSASSSDSAISEPWPVSNACLTITRWRTIWTSIRRFAGWLAQDTSEHDSWICTHPRSQCCSTKNLQLPHFCRHVLQLNVGQLHLDDLLIHACTANDLLSTSIAGKIYRMASPRDKDTLWRDDDVWRTFRWRMAR